MTELQIERMKRQWAALVALPETSDTLKHYLKRALDRDPVDVAHEITVLADTIAPARTDRDTER